MELLGITVRLWASPPIIRPDLSHSNHLGRQAMNDATLPVFASLLLGVVAGPLVWWLGREVLRFVAWHLEYGKAWLPDLAEQEFHCPACAKNFGLDEAACSGCGKSREVAYYASIREVDIAAEQVLRLSRMGALDAETAKRMEEGLLRQRGALARMRKPQKSTIGKVELVLPGGEKAEGGYIHPETFHEFKNPGKHPLRLKPVLVTDEAALPTGGLAIFSRMAGWFLVLAGVSCWLHGAFPLGDSRSQIPGLAESWTGLALLLAGIYSLAFGRASALLAHFASFGTGILVPAFWVVGPWIHGVDIAPGDWAVGLACGALCACGGAIIDRYLAQWRGEYWEEGSAPPEASVAEGRLMSFSGLALGILQMGALAGLARPDGWFGPWGAVIGSAWGLVALFGFQLGQLVLSGIRPDFRLPQWLFECAFGGIIALAAGVGASHPIMGVSTLTVGMGLLAFSGMFLACGPTKSTLGLLKPDADKNAPLVVRAAILAGAGGLACAPALGPHPWIGVGSSFIGALSLLAFGAVLRQRAFFVAGLCLVALAGGLGAHEALRTTHHNVFDQSWMVIDGAVLGIALGAGIARILERLAHPQTTLAGSATLWMRLFSVQVLMACAIASLVWALVHRNLSEVHDWTNPVTALAWAITLVLVAQVRSLRGHGFGLLAISGSILFAGILDKITGRSILSVQAGLFVTGCGGLLLAMGIGRIRPSSRRLSKVSISWAMALLGIHVSGVLAIVIGRNAGWEALAIPSVVGGATWMLISRNRNLPGLGWVALFWMAAGVTPYASRLPSVPEQISPFLAMALIGLFLWWWIAPARILRRARPVGPVFAILVGILSFIGGVATNPLDVSAGAFVGISVVLLALAPRVWDSSRMLWLLAVAFASLVILLGRNFAEISSRDGPEIWAIGLGVFVVGIALMARIGRNFPRWRTCQFQAVSAVGFFVLLAGLAACVIAPIAMVTEQSLLGLGLLVATPFAVALAIASLSSLLPGDTGLEFRPKLASEVISHDNSLQARAGNILDNMALCLGFIAWSGIGVLAYCLAGRDYPIFALAVFGFLWAVAIAVLDSNVVASLLLGKNKLIARKILFGISLTGASLALFCMLGMELGKTYLETVSCGMGVLTAIGMASCLYLRSREMAIISYELTRSEMVHVNRGSQELYGHGIWVVLALGAWMLWRTLGSVGEITHPVLWSIGISLVGAAAIALLRGGELRWMARPGALQLTGTLGVVSLVFLACSIYETLREGIVTLEEEVTILRAGNDFHFQGSFAEMAMVCSIALGLTCAYFERLRPKNPHPGEPGSDWGMNFGGQTPFAIAFWFALAITVMGYLCSSYFIRLDNAYLLTIGLVPPIFGYLAHKSSQPAFQGKSSKSASFPTFEEGNFDLRKVA